MRQTVLFNLCSSLSFISCIKRGKLSLKRKKKYIIKLVFGLSLFPIFTKWIHDRATVLKDSFTCNQFYDELFCRHITQFRITMVGYSTLYNLLICAAMNSYFSRHKL